MSVTADYMLILGKDVPLRESPERAKYDLERAQGLLQLDASTAMLMLLVDSVDWDGDKPAIGKLDGHFAYFWWGTIGPYYKEADGVYPPLEALIEETKLCYPNLDDHYSLIVWMEGELQRIDGRFIEHNIHYTKTVLVPSYSDPDRQDWEDIRIHFKHANRLTSDYKNGVS
jgi:hypothetical protein